MPMPGDDEGLPPDENTDAREVTEDVIVLSTEIRLLRERVEHLDTQNQQAHQALLTLINKNRGVLDILHRDVVEQLRLLREEQGARDAFYRKLCSEFLALVTHFIEKMTPWPATILALTALVAVALTGTTAIKAGDWLSLETGNHHAENAEKLREAADGG